MNKYISGGLSLAALAAFGLGLPSPAAAGNLVQNGGFETGSLTGWTLNDPSGDTFVDNGISSGLTPHSGNYLAALGATGVDGTLTQDIATTAGDTYHASFWLVSDGSPGQSSDQNFEAQFAGQDLVLPAYKTTSYQEFILNGTATSSITPLTFTFRDDPGVMGLDDVAVNPGQAPVPEASSMISLAIFLLAGVTLAAVSRRKARLPAA